MLENLYTTKMSSSKRVLQKRFTKIRTKSTALAKLMSLAMTLVLVFALTAATVVIAAAGGDGLEHWDKNELYFLCSTKSEISFDNAPQWVYDDVSDIGKAETEIKCYVNRTKSGCYEPVTIIALTGNKGSVKLASHSYCIGGFSREAFEGIPELSRENRQKPALEICFVEHNYEGIGSFRETLYNQLLGPLSGKCRAVDLMYVLSENSNIESAYIGFGTSDKHDNPVSRTPYTPISYSKENDIGEYEEYIRSAAVGTFNFVFSDFEKNYKNKKADGINIAVKKALESGIELDIKTALSVVKETYVYIYNEYGAMVDIENNDDVYSAIKSNYTIPYIKKFYPENNEGRFLKGNKYRICVHMTDENYNIVYRWQDYVTIK